MSSLLLLGSGALRAQAPTARFSRLGSEAGLSHNSVLAIAQDSNGFLWIGTTDGLNRYDGYEFLTYRHDPTDPSTLSNNLVRALLEDRSGNLWIGTENGLDRLEPGAERIQRYPLRQAHDDEVRVNQIFEGRDGRLWAGTSRGLFLYQPGDDHYRLFAAGSTDSADPPSLEHQDVFAIQEDASGTLWVLTTAFARGPHLATLHRFDTAANRFERLSLAPEWGPVYTLLIDSRDRIWINAVGPGVPASELATPVAPEGTVATTPVWALLEDSRGALWMGSEAGLFRQGANAETVTLVDNDLSDRAWLRSFVLAILEDRAGALWIGTLSGLYHRDPHAKPFRLRRHDPANARSLSSDAVSAITEDEAGVLWVGTFGSGLNRIDPHKGVVRYRYGAGDPAALCHDLIWSLRADYRGRLWIGTETGLCSLDLATGRFRRHELPRPTPGLSDLRITDIAGPRDGALWLGSFEGLYRYEPASGVADHYPATSDESGPGDRQISSLLLTDEGVLWIGTIEGVLDRLETASGRFDHYPLTTASGQPLSTEGIFDIQRDGRGALWLGTGSGLSRFDPQSESFINYFEHDGLPGSIVYGILPGEDGRFWLSTNQGLSRFDPRLSDGGRFRNFREDEGVGSTEFNRHAAWRGSSGELFFGGLGGVTSFLPGEIRNNEVVPPMAITRIQVASRAGTRDIDPIGLDQLQLSHSDSTFSFEFTALNFTSPERNRYAYRLEAFDDGWVEAGDRRFARYTSIPAGNYLFRVKGSNNDGIWNEAGTSLAVVITPPHWETWWFRLAAVALLAGLLVAAYRYRIRQLIAVERLRLRIAADLHDDLGGELSAIALTTAMVEERGGLSEDDRARLANARRAALKVMDALRDVVWYIKPEHDTVDGLARRMRAVATSLLDGTDYTIDCELPRSSRIDALVRRHVFLIYKEALHNIVKHAHAGRVTIRFVPEGEGMLLEVADDGVGFDVGSNGEGHGLGNLGDRAAQIGAALRIESRPGAGTSIRLTFAPERRRRRRRIGAPS